MKNEGMDWVRNACVWLRQNRRAWPCISDAKFRAGQMSQKFQSPQSYDEQAVIQMGIQKKTRKFAQVKRIIGQRDARLKKNQLKGEEKTKPKGDDVVREM